MSYWDIAEMAADSDLQRRITAAAAQEQDGDPWAWVGVHLLNVCAQPGWDAAWASAVAAENPSPGRDPGVITDGMILSGVQAVAGGA